MNPQNIQLKIIAGSRALRAPLRKTAARDEGFLPGPQMYEATYN